MFVTNRYIRFLYQIIKIILTFPFFLIGFLIPSRKDIWIFGHTYGYIDNPKYLYQFLIANKEEGVRPIWITKEKNAEYFDGENYYYLSLKGIYYQYRASVACIATGGGDLASFTLGRVKIVQLWHGIPLKKLLLDSPESSPFPLHWKSANKIFYFLLKRHLNKYDLIIAANKHNQSCLAKAFGVPLEKVKITGLPRHDIILEKQKVGVQSRILYAPTWHPSLIDAEKAFNGVFSAEFIEYCIREKIKVDISIHPNNRKLKDIIPNYSFVDILDKKDINTELSKYDILITDYSSIAIDFSILNKPIVFCCHNLVKYQKERGVYTFFTDILNERKVHCESILTEIELIKSKNYQGDNFYDLQVDTLARWRVVHEIKKLIDL